MKVFIPYKKSLFLVLILLVALPVLGQRKVVLLSPDKRIQFRFLFTDSLPVYSIVYNNVTIVEPLSLRLSFNDNEEGTFGHTLKISKAKYVGSITNHDERSIKIDFIFLSEGNYTAEIYTDAEDTNKNPNNLNKKIINITNGDAIAIKLESGGGRVTHIYKT